MLDFLWMGLAFAMGVGASFAKLPPLVGYLLAGFILKALGAESNVSLELFSEMGITLLLFTIGLKLNIRTLGKPEVLGVTLFHSFCGILAAVSLFFLLPVSLSPMEILLVAFALSFSSTVFVFRILEDRGDLSSHYGRLAVGVLIIQDILAVLFLAFSANKIPSTWLLGVLVAMWPLRLILLRIFSKVPHGELMLLFGFAVALSGSFLFDLVNVKGDLGALIFGILLGRHSRATELSKNLMSLKNFFLLGFFLSIGMNGLPNWSQVGWALLFCLALPLRSFLYFLLFSRFGLRTRTSFLSSLALFNYSEFGLIVLAVGASAFGLDSSWMTIMALTMSFSFLFSSLLNHRAEELTSFALKRFSVFEKRRLHPEERSIELGKGNVMIFGLGRVGAGAYEVFEKKPEWRPIGFDVCAETVSRYQSRGWNVQVGSATNPDFWSAVPFSHSQLELIMLAMPVLEQNLSAATYIRKAGFKGRLASIAKYSQDIEELQKAGVDRAFNVYAEAGVGFAQSTCDFMEPMPGSRS